MHWFLARVQAYRISFVARRLICINACQSGVHVSVRIRPSSGASGRGNLRWGRGERGKKFLSLRSIFFLLFFSPFPPETPHTQVRYTLLRTLRWHDGEDKENVKQAMGWISKTHLCTFIKLFGTFLCRHCKNSTGKCLISRFMEDLNKRRLNFLSLSELEYGS